MTEPTKPALTVDRRDFEATMYPKFSPPFWNGRYESPTVQNIWECWQASRRHTLGEVIRKLSKEVDRLRGLKSGVRDYQHSDQADILEQFAEKLEAELKAKTGQCAATIVSGLR